MSNLFTVTFRLLLDYTECKSEVDITLPVSIYDLRTPESAFRAAFNGQDLSIQMRAQKVAVTELRGEVPLPKPHWLRTNKLPVIRVENGKFAGCNIQVPRERRGR